MRTPAIMLLQRLAAEQLREYNGSSGKKAELWTPLPGPPTLAYQCPADILFLVLKKLPEGWRIVHDHSSGE